MPSLMKSVPAGTQIGHFPLVPLFQNESKYENFLMKNREIKLGVTWSYVKRQTAKMKLLSSVFSSLNSRVKIFVFLANSRRHFPTFMRFNEGLEEKNTSSSRGHLRRLPFDVRPRNVKLNLSNDFDLHGNEITCRTHFHTNSFALKLVLKQRYKRIRKWPIWGGFKVNDLITCE